MGIAPIDESTVGVDKIVYAAPTRNISRSHETIQRIFMAPPKRHEVGEVSPLPAPVASATWEERMAALDEVLCEPGGARTMKITLTGRPGKVVDKGTYILTTMPTQKVPTLPRGLPPIPADAVPPQTLVMVAKKQWAKVDAASAASILVLEGFALYEPAINGLAVLATT
jgi:hypothetical protein